MYNYEDNYFIPDMSPDRYEVLLGIMNNVKKLAKVTDKSRRFSGWLIGDNAEDLKNAFLENYNPKEYCMDFSKISNAIALQRPEGCGCNMATDKNGDPVLFKFTE